MNWRRLLPYVNIVCASIMFYFAGYWYVHAWWVDHLSMIESYSDICRLCASRWRWYSVGYAAVGIINLVAAVWQLVTREPSESETEE